ncbi:uncharacterized protein LOC100875510 [Megachile rotundata]|uniref:uncharacterized protein LOC100875510 n=1 Tax=Megachile rotundata TaxID=143995 RepID=UPI003FD557D6
MRSILKILFIFATFALIVHAHNRQCTCGNLGEGKNPCTCSDVVVKATKLPKPMFYASPQQINNAAATRLTITASASQNGYSESQSSSNSGTQSTSNSNACGSGSSTSSDSSGTLVVYDNDASASETNADNQSGCGCSSSNQKVVESLDIDNSQSSNGEIVPSFSPIGDLCNPLPVDSRTGKLIEKTIKVVPAYPGKIVCQNCNPVAPYQVCVNSLTGEIISRTIISGSSDAISKSGTLMYENSNSAMSSTPQDSVFGPMTFGKTGTMSGSASRTFSGSRVTLHKNTNSGMFSELTPAKYKLPIAYANLNSANGQRQYSKMTLSSSDCFDDTAGGSQVDYSYPAIPADAVSLTLAYKNLRAPNVIYRQGKQFVPEDKLSFGHRTVPNDIKSDSKILDIAEEKLVTVDKPVVELKIAPPRTVVIGSYDEREEAKLAELEAIERESITQEENIDQMSDSLITYKDLGYAPVDATYMHSRKYNGAISYNEEINDSAEEPCGPLGPPLSDYVPGRVVVQQEIVRDNIEDFNGGMSGIIDSRQSSRSEPCPNSQLLPKLCTICVPFPKVGYQSCDYIKLANVVKIKEFFSIKRMKNKNFIPFLFSVVLCAATLVLANGDQSIGTQVPDIQLQNSSLESSQDPLRTSQEFPLRKNVTEEATEVPESVTWTSPATTDVNHNTTDETSTEPMETLNQDVTTKFSILPKRYAITPTPEEYPETDFSWEEEYKASLSLDRLDSYSCIEEASEFGHKEAAGVLLHEVICEFRKLWHYFMIAVQNLQNELQLDLPIETEEAMILLSDFVMSGAVFDKIEQGIVQLEVFLENPENVNVMLDLIEKCVPISNIHETVNRIRIAISNFFVHLQGFIIYFEPHEGIQNYIELLKKWEEKLGAAAQIILDLFDIHLETEMHLLLEFASSARLLLHKLSFEESIEYNLTVLKDFIDTFYEVLKQYHTSDSSRSAIINLHSLIAKFISAFLPQNINIPVIHFVLPNKEIANLSLIWHITNETFPHFPSIPYSQSFTAICSSQLLEIFGKEAELFSELSSLVIHAFEKLCSGQTFEEHLTIFKDSIDQLLNIYRKYLEFSGSVIDKLHTFILNLFLTNFNIPLLHFKTANGTAVLSLIWHVRNTASSFSLPSSTVNVTSVFKDVTISQITASSTSIQHTETSKLPFAIDRTDVTSSAAKTTVASASESIIQSPVSISNLLTPNDGSQGGIHSTTSAINTIIQPHNYGSSEHYSSQPKPTTSLPFGLPSDIFSVLPNVQSNDKSDPSRTTSPPSSSTTQKDSPPSDSLTTKIPNVSDRTPSYFDRRHNNRQTPVPSSPGKTNGIPSNNLMVPSFFENVPIPSSDPKNPANTLTSDPPTSTTSTERTDPLTTTPTTPSSSERPTDSLTTNPAIRSSVPEKPANMLANNSQSPAAIPQKLADLLTNPSILSSTPAKPFDLLRNSAPIAPGSPGKPTDLLSNSLPTTSDPAKPDSGTNNFPIPSLIPGRPTDLGTNRPPIPSLVPGRSMDFLTNTPQISPFSPLNSFINNPSIPPSAPGESVDPRNPAIPSPDKSADPLIPSPSFERPGDPSVNNPPILPFMFERPTDYSFNNPSSFGRPTEFLEYNAPIFASAPGRPDFVINNPLIFPYHLRRPVDFSSDAYISAPGESSPSILFLNEPDRDIEKSNNEPLTPYIPPDYLIPASNIIPNLPRYQPVSNSYVNYLESIDAFYKSLYSYLQYGNPAIAPPPNVSSKISEFLRRGFPPSSPMSMDNSNLCGTSASLPSLSGLTSILKNDIKRSQSPFYLPRKEIASALGNTVLSPGDLIVILSKNGLRLIGHVIDTVSPIYFKPFEVKTAFGNPQDSIKIWHLRSKDFHNPKCEQQLEFLFRR